MLFAIGVRLDAAGRENSATTGSRPGVSADSSPVVLISPQEDSNPQTTNNRVLSKDEAYDLVWNLPEVRSEIKQILEQAGIPVASVAMRPDPAGVSEEKNPFYAIRFQGIKAIEVLLDLLFYVDAHAGNIFIHDSFKGTPIPLHEWRRIK